MAISGISSYGLNSLYGYQSTINSLRLTQALYKNPKLNPASSSSSVSSVTSQKAAKNANVAFVKEYSSSMTDLMNAANELRNSNKSGAMSDLAVTSSNEKVATASGKLLLKNDKDFELDVTQIAQAQMNVSEGVKASAYAQSGMNFTVGDDKNSVNVQVSAVKANGGSKTNAQMLREAADQINKSKANVTASVIEKDGVASLQIESKETGTSHTFEVSGEMGAAAGAENVKTEAANAKYSVTSGGIKTDYESESNTVSVGYVGVSAQLKGTGQTTLKADVDTGKAADALGKLVDAYNSSLKFLNNNFDRGTGIGRQMQSLLNGLGSEQSLKQMGITVNKDATLSFSKSTFEKNMAKDPSLTRDLVSGTGGLAERMFNKARSGLNMSSNSLTNGYTSSVYSGSYGSSSKQSATNPYAVLGMYSRSGVYNMSNYNAVGMMMNYLI